ncbi:DUF6586 family protein [Kushneria phosphatilytica]|uniref:Uncharacterized protein n=1 Tax=Kushneria phosphatilytica TaxID=657387 RepID=A0A1S1P2Q3_9GAMM|nr:DUF6586 family protein [Kushneria phosphatilytica]OHV13060.1 hypothetical protein BH688_03430 [Kushneria phosphatilytica]QEL10933.1 hypothetical protein FY550_07185 [Kushneria phosphatilytica]
MSARARTNQLLYQARLLLAMPVGEDEHADARRMALEESALAQLELALASLIEEIAHICNWPDMEWRQALLDPPRSVAEIERLRALREDGSSWLARLLWHIDRLHGEEGAAMRQRPSMTITTTGRAGLADDLHDALAGFATLLPALRETGVEW